MTMFRADTTRMEALVSDVDRASGDATALLQASLALLVTHGYVSSASGVVARSATVDTWSILWAASLRTRVGILSDAEPIPSTTVADRAERMIQRTRGVLVDAAQPGAPGGDGDATAVALLDALEQGERDVAQRLVARIAGLSETEVVAFFERLGADITGLLPALLLDAGVAGGDLARYLAPLGAGLSRAATVNDGMALSFTGAEMMAGHEGAAVTPAVYFDFAVFPVEFVLTAASSALAAYADEELPLRGPEYQLPDGSIAEPDPRLPLIRAVLGMATADRLGFLGWVNDGGKTAGLVAPATEWADGGEAVGTLLALLAATPDRSTAAAIVMVMRAIADAGRLSPGVSRGAAVMIAPHLASLVIATWFGDQVEIEQTAVRPVLDEQIDGDWLVSAFMARLAADPDARAVMHQAFAALLAATISGHFDPGDSESLAGVADDLGALWQVVFGAGLQADLDTARLLDARSEQAGTVVKHATGLIVAGSAVTIASMGFAAWMAEQVASMVDVATPVEGLLGGTTHTEDALIGGFETMAAGASWVALILAAEMHHRGLLELPDELLDADLATAALDDASRELLLTALVDAGVDPEAWFNDVFAIIAYGVPTPR